MPQTCAGGAAHARADTECLYVVTRPQGWPGQPAGQVWRVRFKGGFHSHTCMQWKSSTSSAAPTQAPASAAMACSGSRGGTGAARSWSLPRNSVFSDWANDAMQTPMGSSHCGSGTSGQPSASRPCTVDTLCTVNMRGLVSGNTEGTDSSPSRSISSTSGGCQAPCPRLLCGSEQGGSVGAGRAASRGSGTDAGSGAGRPQGSWPAEPLPGPRRRSAPSGRSSSGPSVGVAAALADCPRAPAAAAGAASASGFRSVRGAGGSATEDEAFSTAGRAPASRCGWEDAAFPSCLPSSLRLTCSNDALSAATSTAR
mmetsp:Transcript_118840/g.361534  ORF Transcript_118840/g.361534 Transcript_118840/m.361534 type:complete len:312 (-) Transcript_118840:136-1071(-)